INPLMRGGIVPKDIQKRLYEEGWMEVGYDLCFDCIQGRSSLITKPPVKSFLGDVAKFFGGDVAEHTFGCRSAQYAVMRTVSVPNKGDGGGIVIADPNSHYSTNIAAEMCNLKVVEPPHTGYPEYKVTADSYVDKIEDVLKEHERPALVMATHADPYYGNLAPVSEIGKICQEYEIPYLVNSAYTGGVMPINMKEMNADFLTLSAHKSMASIGPLGFLVTTYEWSKKAFMTSQEKPDWTGRGFGKKIPNLFGCSIGALPIISAIFSFPYVKERVKNWADEVKKTEKFVDDLEDLGDIMLLGERPHRHHLLHFETPVFWEISKNHKRKGFFLAEEMSKEGVVGLHKGLSKHIKLSVYGLSDAEIERVYNAFAAIVERHS
ncbi:MAG: O-phospho-L-seryl-tRNA:Cys-tRNA synthase, partial [Candidatus Hydrothermarchaeales archaeon]